MKFMIRNVDDHGRKYSALAFCCPGCAEIGGSGLHMLPVNSDWKTPQWEWDGDIESPTLSPSILTRTSGDTICHSYIRGGRIEFLGDCTHSLAGQTVDLLDLPEWFVK